MIINNEDAVARLNSPKNLMNQLRSLGSKPKNDAMNLFGIGKKENLPSSALIPPDYRPFIKQLEEKIEPQISVIEIPEAKPTTLDNILHDNESQINLGLAHDSALKLLNASVALLSTKLDDVKADKLPSVISAASKTVESIRKERSEALKHGEERAVHYHFYTPQQKKVTDYEVIDVA